MGLYYHHGIYLGQNKVAEVVNDDVPPRFTSLDGFTDSGKKTLYRINYNQCDPPQRVIGRAENFVANPAEWGEYSLPANNCEHFATFCKTGRRASEQVLKKLRSFLIQDPLGLWLPNV